MIFQLMDNKLECSGVYLPNKFIYGRIPEGLTKTWSWSRHLDGRDIDYASLWASGKSIDEMCPEHLAERWSKAKGLIKSHFNSFNTAKMNMNDVCLFDVVPQKHLQHYYDCKNEITEWVFSNIERPANYYFMKETQDNLKYLSQFPIKLNTFSLYCVSDEDQKAKHLYEEFSEKTPRIEYDIFGTITGRLTTKKGSFPILNLKSELKKEVKPNNHVFLELDFNAAEVRTMLALQNIQQPVEDIHEWNIENVFKQQISREQAKTKLFAWLYNPDSETIQSDLYNRKSLLERYYDGEKIQTPFGRSIPCPLRKALNYLLQSSSSDNTLDRFNKISRYLRGSKSHVAAVVHDSIIIDLHEDDRKMIPYLKQIFEDTKLGKFKVNVSLGKNLGNMKKFEW